MEPDRSWSSSHEDIDPAHVPFLRGWLAGVAAVARPLIAAGVSPDAVTAAGVLASVAVPVLARAGCPGVAVPVLLASVGLDGLDGAVARGTGRESSYGRALDSTCDRISELAWWSALATVGVPVRAVSVTAALTLGMEMWRARSGTFGALTVWERPSRTILAVMALGAASAHATGRAPARIRGIRLGTITGGVGLTLSTVGAMQLAIRAGVGPST